MGGMAMAPVGAQGCPECGSQAGGRRFREVDPKVSHAVLTGDVKSYKGEKTSGEIVMTSVLALGVGGSSRQSPCLLCLYRKTVQSEPLHRLLLFPPEFHPL